MHIDRLDWEANIIQDMFNKRDADLISLIPLKLDSDDNWFWAYEKSVAYSV